MYTIYFFFEGVRGLEFIGKKKKKLPLGVVFLSLGTIRGKKLVVRKRYTTRFVQLSCAIRGT